MSNTETHVPLVTRAANLRTRLEAAEQNEGTRQYVRDLRDRHAQVRSDHQRAAELLLAKSVLAAVDSERTRDACTAADPMERELKNLARGLRRNPKRIVQDNGYPSRRAQRCLDGIGEALLGVWQGVVGDLSAFENACVLAEGISEAAPKADELQRVIGQLKEAARSLPSEGEPDRIAVLRERANGLLMDLEQLIPSGPVREFLQAMRDGGAVSLEDVLANEGLLEWLRAHDAAASYEVRPQGTRRNWF